MDWWEECNNKMDSAAIAHRQHTQDLTRPGPSLPLSRYEGWRIFHNERYLTRIQIKPVNNDIYAPITKNILDTAQAHPTFGQMQDLLGRNKRCLITAFPQQTLLDGQTRYRNMRRRQMDEKMELLEIRLLPRMLSMQTHNSYHLLHTRRRK
jgi:hypothetical protein